MRRRSHVGGILLALFCLSLFSPSLYAQDSSDTGPTKEIIKKVEEHNRKGIEFYKAGQLPEAVQEMLEAYHLIPSNDLLYNIARIYQKMGEFDLALKYFKDYVASPGVKPANVKKALEKMAEVRDQQKAKEREKLLPATAVPDLPATAEPAPKPAVQPQEPARAPVAPQKVDLNKAAPSQPAGVATSWVIAGVGGAVALVGAGFGLAASSAFSDFEGANSDDAKLNAQKRTEKWSAAADISYALSVGTLAGALLWHFLIDAQQPVAIRVAPTVSKHGFGMQVSMPLTNPWVE